MRVVACLSLILAVPSVAQESFVNWETPTVHPLEITPDGARLLAVNLPDARLEVLDLVGGMPAPAYSIPVGLDPVSVRVRTNDEVWVVNHISDTVSVVGLTQRNVVATLDVADEPCDIVFAGTPERAFVSCSQAGEIWIFDPANLDAAATVVTIDGEDPRALAVSPDGSEVYAAIFESGNRSTILGGGSVANISFPPNVVNELGGPHGGVNPPPNSGSDFVPSINGALPAPPAVGLIVKKDGAGNWMDDNGGDWSDLVSGASAGLSGRPVGWDLADHDVAVIDATTFSVSYVKGLMNLCMALAVHPVTGDVSVVGTDGTNEIRFEPNLTGRFLRVLIAQVDPNAPGAANIVDLNPQVDYSTSTVSQTVRDMALADPRGMIWNAAGTKAYVCGLGSDNVVVLDGAGARAGLADTIEVGAGPAGLAIDDGAGRLFVLNRFENSISVVDLSTELELQRVSFHDATPAAVKVGRPHLYDGHATSGLGFTACASCHADARLDRLAWDLGDPSGAMKSVAGQNLGANVPGLNTGFQDFHPMKGPMTTQTLQDIIGHEPLHWRGDRDGLEEFNGAFQGLQGDDQMLTGAEMQEYEDFLATIHYPPNPFREFDNTLPTNLDLEGHFATGLFGLPLGADLPSGNALNGLALYRPPNLLDAGALACVTCHTLPTGTGPDYRLMGFSFKPFPEGPNGERHHSLVSIDGSTNVSMKVPQLRNLYEKVGMDQSHATSTAGFGLLHDGSVDTIARFVTEPIFLTSSDQQTADLVAFLLAFSGSDLPQGSTTNLFEPPGTASRDTHAAVGTQLTLASATPAVGDLALLAAMGSLADAGEVGLVVKGLQSGLQRGWVYLGSDQFQSDRLLETTDQTALIAGAGPGAERTYTLVPTGTQTRLGVDRDGDGFFDRDEIEGRGDPANPNKKPKVSRPPPGRRP